MSPALPAITTDKNMLTYTYMSEAFVLHIRLRATEVDGKPAPFVLPQSGHHALDVCVLVMSC